jgi:hypothetical protein
MEEVSMSARSRSGMRDQRGVAMLVTLFALLLLTVIGLGMLLSASTETTINSNYKDKQTATMAVMAGLQEARDRIQPATLHINPPTQLPTLTNGAVIYIINPKNGETVAPWDTTNKYMDTELCQEGILGLSGTSGVPCTTLPTGSTWYTAHNNSLSSAAPWNFANPLDFKWVRITLKRNNMTPVAANGTSSNSNQVCWDGNNQLVLPNGYGPTCNRFGGVIYISVTQPGNGYATAPTVVIDPPPTGGIQATATANMIPADSSSVSAVNISAAGTGYTAPPIISFTGGGGTGAAAVATVSPTGSPVDTLTLTSAGSQCYSVAPSVIFTGGGGVGAAATATLASTDTCVAGLTITGNCTARKSPPNAALVSGVGLTSVSGSGLSDTLEFGNGAGPATVNSIQNGGDGYTTIPTAPVTFGSGAACPLLVATPVLGRRIQNVTLTAGGSGYTSVPTVSFTAGTGTTAAVATATATLGAPTSGGQVTAITVTAGGTGYTSAPVVFITPDVSDTTGMNATAAASIGAVAFRVGSITITNEGYGYTSDPAVSFTGGGGAGATASATLGRGANYGKIYLITGLAETATGARSMVQMEATTSVTGFSSAAALILDGPLDPLVPPNFPNSDNFVISGIDANSCLQTPETDHPAIGAYDDPNADPATESLDTVVDNLPRPDHYIGEGDAPSVKNVFGSLGETLGTPTGLKALIDAIAAVKTNVGNTVSLGTMASPAINYIDGDLTLNGNAHGYGVLVVTGTLEMGGDFHWWGPVLVVGDGIFEGNGGGTGTITGTMIIAKIWDNHMDQNLLDENGLPSFDWVGGGNNGIHYDHCWATNMMAKIPFDAPVSTRPLKVLSYRTLPY